MPSAPTLAVPAALWFSVLAAATPGLCDPSAGTTGAPPGSTQAPPGKSEAPPGRPDSPPGRPDAPRGRSDVPIDKQSEIGPRILACWHPPAEGDEITLRLSFRRDGSLFGKPRITYVKAVGGADGEAALANSIFEAIQDCGPLRFTPALGAVIAGRLFLIRFVAPRKALRASL